MFEIALQLDQLIEDEDMYPRLHVDSLHVNNLAAAISSGEDVQAYTPIVVDQDLRLIDGWHRVRALTKVYGGNYSITVKQQFFSTRAEALTAAVAANASHGRKLDERDKTRSIQLLRAEGINEDRIAAALHTTEEQVMRLAVRVVEVEGEYHPAPRVLWPKSGEPVRSVSAEQFAVAQTAPGWSLSQQVRTLRRELQAGLADPEDEELESELKMLCGVVNGLLRKKEQPNWEKVRPGKEGGEN